MPGLTLAFAPFTQPESLLCRFREAQTSMRHAPDYQAVLDKVSAGCVVGHVSYPEYPMEAWSSGGYDVVVEGRVYDTSHGDVRAEVGRLANMVFNGGDRNRRVGEWIWSHDGEYVIVIVDREHRRVAVVTDALGRLPLFYRANENVLYLSRECKFIVAMDGVTEFDPIGWAEYLWLRYPFGERTLFRNVKSTPGGTLLVSEAREERIETEVQNVALLNLEDHNDSLAERGDIYARLGEALMKGVRDRARATLPGRNVVSLSGGWDSRITAAALSRVDREAVAASFVRADGRGKRDADIAEQIAQTLSIPIERVPVPTASAKDEERLVHVRDGLNYVSMAFILSFMERVVARWGRSATIWVGDGAERIFKSITLDTKAEGVEGTARYFAARNGLVPADVAEAVLGLARGTLFNELVGELSRYPERKAPYVGAHFIIYGRTRRWNFEGEDRARVFMWQTSPYYTPDFLRLGFAVPDRLKSNNRFFQAFHLAFSPEVARFADQNMGLAISNPLFPAYFGLKRRVVGTHWLRKRVKPMLLRDDFGAAEHAFLEQWEREARGSIMHPGAVRVMMAGADQTQAANWRTLALMERLCQSGRYPGVRVQADARTALSA